jgi:hypothetical protein
VVKRVFILGAGFSKHAGLPLAPQLTELLIERAMPSHEWLPEFFADLRRDLAMLGGREPSAVSFEELFDALGPSCTLLRLRAQACTADDTWSARLVDFAAYVEKNVVEWLHDDLYDVLWRMHPATTPPYITKFAEALTASDIVVTFNYDVLVERALTALDRPWNHGFVREGLNGVSILKLHSSLDWAEVDPAARPGAINQSVCVLADTSQHTETSSSPSRFTQLVRAPSWEAVGAARQLQNVWLGPVQWMRHLPPGLGSMKRVENTSGLGQVWQRAIDALVEADRVAIVGYSLPVTDAAVRLAFRAATAQRTKPVLDRFVLVDPGSNPPVDACERVFGCAPRLRKEGAEQVDWSALLD